MCQSGRTRYKTREYEGVRCQTLDGIVLCQAAGAIDCGRLRRGASVTALAMTLSYDWHVVDELRPIGAVEAHLARLDLLRLTAIHTARAGAGAASMFHFRLRRAARLWVDVDVAVLKRSAGRL